VVNKGGKAKQKRRVVKDKRRVQIALVHILATFNNVIVTVSDTQGAVFIQRSAGARFSGSKKSTPHAAHVAAYEAASLAASMGVKTVSVFISGPGAGREAALRAIHSAKLGIISLKDRTPIPHNGCRLRRKRRV